MQFESHMENNWYPIEKLYKENETKKMPSHSRSLSAVPQDIFFFLRFLSVLWMALIALMTSHEPVILQSNEFQQSEVGQMQTELKTL